MSKIFHPIDANQARLLVTITFHFRSARLPFLFKVVRTLLDFPVRNLDIVILTNSAVADELNAIRRLLDQICCFSFESPIRTKTVSVTSVGQLEDPWHLPWAHKDIIKREFLNGRREYTHFINLEDDLDFSFAAFCYFLRYRHALAIYGVIPSFIRVEYNFDQNLLYCTDAFHVTRTDNRKIIDLDGIWFMNVENSHIAMFILDQELAAEYVSTQSFNMKTSQNVHTWGICERASMALCFENVPPGFYTRYVVPVHPTMLAVLSDSYIYHVANNYTNNPEHPHGKIPVSQLFSYGESNSGMKPEIVSKIAHTFKEDGSIPATIFQTWKSKRDFPTNYQYWTKTFSAHNPRFEMVLWDDADNLAFISKEFPWFVETYVGYPREIYRADAIRYFFLYQFGGIYADMDVECLRPLDGLLDQGDVLLGRMGSNPAHPHSIPNAIMASRPLEEFWLLVIALLVASAKKIGEPDVVTGPVILKTAFDLYVADDPSVRPLIDVILGLLPHTLQAQGRKTRILLLDSHQWFPVDWTNPCHQALRHEVLNVGLLSEERKRKLFPESWMVTYWTHNW